MKFKKMSRGAGSRHAGKKRTYRKNKNKPVAKIVTKGFWDKKRTATLIVAIFVGLGIVAGVVGYYLSREEAVEAKVSTTYPNGGAEASSISDVAGLKVIGGKQKTTDAGDGKMRFTVENRLGMETTGDNAWRGDIIRKIIKTDGWDQGKLNSQMGWVSLPLEVKAPQGWNWAIGSTNEAERGIDVFTTYFGTSGKPGDAKIFPTDKSGGLKVYQERPGYHYKINNQPTGPVGQYRPTYYPPKDGVYRWCIRFYIEKDNWNKLQNVNVDFNPDLIKRANLLGETGYMYNMNEYQSYFYYNDRSTIPDFGRVRAAGKAGLKAPDKMNSTVVGTKVTLSWDQKAGLNAKGFTVRKRVKGTSGWASESTVLNYPANKYIDSGVVNNRTYDYQLRAVSYFDGIKVNGPTISVKVGTGGDGGEGEPSERYPAAQDLKATAGNQMVSLKWDAPATKSADHTNYEIVRSTTTQDPAKMQKIASVPVTQKSYLNSGLTNGQVYHYAVYAIYKTGKSKPAGPVSATPKVTDIPEDVNQDGLVNWLDVGRVLAYNGFPGIKVSDGSSTELETSKIIVREDVNRDSVVDWLDVGRILAYKGFPQTGATPASEAIKAQ
ncbi:fibronectin type III domain-containing protein [Patescibacteria group bacterium]